MKASLSLDAVAIQPTLHTATGHTHRRGDMRLRPPRSGAFNDQQPAAHGQTGISVGHEDLRSVETLDISTKPGGPPHSQDPLRHQPHGRVHLGRGVSLPGAERGCRLNRGEARGLERGIRPETRSGADSRTAQLVLDSPSWSSFRRVGLCFAELVFVSSSWSSSGGASRLNGVQLGWTRDNSAGGFTRSGVHGPPPVGSVPC